MDTQIRSPLEGVLVIDFTTLAPGPLASLMLANAGAEVIKVERPGIGDEMRIYKDAFGDEGVTFALLNAGKRSITADLKKSEDLIKIKELIKKCDVVLEQFRPGVMTKLGLDYEALAEENPGLIYCSITGFGQNGPKASIAAHDLNYVADTGMLAIGDCSSGKPAIPQLLAADLAAGSYPAVMNILLALQQRNHTGKGTYIDVSMTDCLFPLMFWGLGLGWGSGKWPQYGDQLLTGGSPRYQIYTTSDARFLAVAALEDRFWNIFCDIVKFDTESVDEKIHPQKVIQGIEEIVRTKSAFEWRVLFEGRDACAVIVNTLEEAVQDVHYRTRGVFDRMIETETGNRVNALPLPIVANLQDCDTAIKKVPALGEYDQSGEKV